MHDQEIDMRLSILIFIALTTGCAGASLNKEAESVKVAKSDPPAGCKELGAVNSFGSMIGSAQSDYNALKNRTHEMGGNYVRIDSMTSVSNKLVGTAFKCP